MNKVTGLIFIVCFFLAGNSHAQHLEISPELEIQLQGKTKFRDIMNEVHRYYRSHSYYNTPKLFSEYKKWNRWAWWAARHLNSNGEVDYKTSENFERARTTGRMNAANIAASSNGQWTAVGPFTTSWAQPFGSRGIGRVDRIVFHPTNPAIVFAGTPSGGIWRSNNGGDNWYSISNTLPNCGVSGIVVSSNDPTGNTLYILTGDGNSGGGYFLTNYGFQTNQMGVLVTTNGGLTWARLGNSQTVLANKRCYKLLQLRNFPNVLMVATSTGVYRSTDFGQTWADADFLGTTVFDIEEHPTNDAIIYACTNTFVFKSTDYGETFPINGSYSPNVISCTRSAIAVTPANPNEVYFLQCGGGAANNRISKSTNSGDNYTAINSSNLISGQYSYNCAFAVNRTSNNFMVAGGISLFASNNNGVSFPNNTMGVVNLPGPVPSNYLHSDVHELTYHPVTNVLYAGTDGGVAISTDNGVTWTDKSNGLQIAQYYRMDGVNGVNNLYMGGLQDNGTHYTTNGSDMVYAGTGDGYSVDFSNTNNDSIYFVENSSVSRFRRSTNTLARLNVGFGPTNSFFPDLACHPTDGNIVYVSYDDTIWRSNNMGATWAAINTTFGTTNNGNSYCGGLAVSANQPNRLYAAGGNTVLRSDNQGGSWATISGTTGWPAGLGTITDMAVNNNNANEVWLTFTGGNVRVLYSSNAGASWVNFTGSLPNVPAYAIAYTTDGDAYIGTELGVYFMDFAMNDWVPFYNGLPMVPVTDLFVNEINGNITAATMGRGLWKSDLYTNCSPALESVSGGINGSHFYQSGGELHTAHSMTGSVGNQVRYRSPVRIVLKPNFAIRNGAYMRARIGPCGQGIFNRNGEPAKDKLEALGVVN